MGRLLILFSILVVTASGGCVTHQFQVVDSSTQQPLSGVEVSGYRYREFSPVSNDLSWAWVSMDATSKDGTLSSIEPRSFVPMQNQFKFVFTKPGYKTAEVLSQPGRAFVASPAQEAGWTEMPGDEQHPAITVPTRNFQELANPSRISVPLYRETPTTLPAESNSTRSNPL